MLQTLDLSNNNLTGPLPEFVSQLPNLKILNLEKNKLTGSVPAGLIQKSNDGLLSLSFCENQNLTAPISCGKDKKKKKKKDNFVVPVIVSVVGILILILTVAAVLWRLKRKRKHADVTDSTPSIQQGPLEPSQRQFTYSEVLEITHNFERIVGRGGFGTVYHGYIDDTQVAVKMLSPSSIQGYQEFYSAVNLLMRVHHRNLTSLVGYCKDGTNTGLIYEYMANGNLHKLSAYREINSRPPDDGTHVWTRVAGTPGYYLSNMLNEKSDVYSFGIVLLEIITSRPALSKTHEKIHIGQWVVTELKECLAAELARNKEIRDTDSNDSNELMSLKFTTEMRPLAR
ncbi:hypothetical protein L3X38_016157 [Prunus dulcis]|uniref:Protein kinase domain-containing protein n=1 Tax=Prunus dulcis TaxID=3755 RepID=A0AAD4W4V9_PRUDU|nr:hypothetical protein L3X38_016157 [Prunus dulcis]